MNPQPKENAMRFITLLIVCTISYLVLGPLGVLIALLIMLFTTAFDYAARNIHKNY